MPAVPPFALSAAALALRTSLGRRLTRRALFALARTELPPFAVDWLAQRAPSGEATHDASPLLDALRAGAPTDVTLSGDKWSAHGRERATRADGSTAGSEPMGDAPLAGERVVVKDSLDVEGEHTYAGLRDGELARQDSELVARLRRAGASAILKSKMTELGMDGLGALMPHAMPPNPRAPRHFAGGSSTGTAVAVASGLARYGVGGDGLGSVRIPAAYTGLVGLKPGRDRLSTRGYASVAPSVDVPGPMAKSADDCARLFSVLAGEPVEALVPLVPARVGLVRGLGPERASREIRRAFSRALDTLGTERVAIEIDDAVHHTLLTVMIATYELARSPIARRAIEARALSAQGELNVALGRALRDTDEARLERRRRALRDATLRALDRVGFLAMPTTAVQAPAIRSRLLAGGQDAMLLSAVGAYTPLANCTGLPAIAIPSGVDARGRPLSIMFVGAPGTERDLLRIAAAMESSELGTRPV